MTVVIILDSLLYNCPVGDSFLSFVLNWLWILSVSLQFPFCCWLFLLLAGLKVKNSLTKWQSTPQNSRDNSSFLRKMTGFVPHFWIFDHTLSLFLSAHHFLCLSYSFPHLQSSTWFHMVSLRPLVGLRHPSNSFLHSLYAFCAKHNSLWRSLSMLVPRKRWTVPQLTGVYGRVRVPRHLDSSSSNCPVLHHFSSDFYFSRWGWGWERVHIGSLES